MNRKHNMRQSGDAAWISHFARRAVPDDRYFRKHRRIYPAAFSRSTARAPMSLRAAETFRPHDPSCPPPHRRARGLRQSSLPSRSRRGRGRHWRGCGRPPCGCRRGKSPRPRWSSASVSPPIRAFGVVSGIALAAITTVSATSGYQRNVKLLSMPSRAASAPARGPTSAAA